MAMNAFTTSYQSSLLNYIMDPQWKAFMQRYNPYLIELEMMLNQLDRQGVTVYPPRHLIFNALNLTPLEKVRVVILGQDPYHEEGQAMGLAYSVPIGVKIPPSLRNIFKALQRDLGKEGFETPNHGCLVQWALNGVLLLNSTLTVTAHFPNSHFESKWQLITDGIIRYVSDMLSGVVFILLGNFAKMKENLINYQKHSIIKRVHPVAVPHNMFIFSNCFLDVNMELMKFGKPPVDWNLLDFFIVVSDFIEFSVFY